MLNHPPFPSLNAQTTRSNSGNVQPKPGLDVLETWCYIHLNLRHTSWRKRSNWVHWKTPLLKSSTHFQVCDKESFEEVILLTKSHSLKKHRMNGWKKQCHLLWRTFRQSPHPESYLQLWHYSKLNWQECSKYESHTQLPHLLRLQFHTECCRGETDVRWHRDVWKLVETHHYCKPLTWVHKMEKRPFWIYLLPLLSVQFDCHHVNEGLRCCRDDARNSLQTAKLICSKTLQVVWN